MPTLTGESSNPLYSTKITTLNISFKALTHGFPFQPKITIKVILLKKSFYSQKSSFLKRFLLNQEKSFSKGLLSEELFFQDPIPLIWGRTLGQSNKSFTLPPILKNLNSIPGVQKIPVTSLTRNFHINKTPKK